jgi:hypothetical protein
VAWPVLLRWRPRCSAPCGDSTGDGWRLYQTRWGGGVLTGHGRWQWGGENNLARWRAKGMTELWWPGRASMSPAAGGEDGGGEAWSKRGGRRGTTKLTEGGDNGAVV